MAIYARRCVYCNRLFEAHTTRALYCSPKCRVQAHREGMQVIRVNTKCSTDAVVRAALSQLRADRDVFNILSKRSSTEWHKPCAAVRDGIGEAIHAFEQARLDRGVPRRQIYPMGYEVQAEDDLVAESLIRQGVLHPTTYEPCDSVLDLEEWERRILKTKYLVDVAALEREAEEKYGL